MTGMRRKPGAQQETEIPQRSKVPEKPPGGSRAKLRCFLWFLNNNYDCWQSRRERSGPVPAAGDRIQLEPPPENHSELQIITHSEEEEEEVGGQIGNKQTGNDDSADVTTKAIVQTYMSKNKP